MRQPQGSQGYPQSGQQYDTADWLASDWCAFVSELREEIREQIGQQIAVLSSQMAYLAGSLAHSLAADAGALGACVRTLLGSIRQSLEQRVSYLSDIASQVGLPGAPRPQQLPVPALPTPLVQVGGVAAYTDSQTTGIAPPSPVIQEPTVSLLPTGAPATATSVLSDITQAQAPDAVAQSTGGGVMHRGGSSPPATSHTSSATTAYIQLRSGTSIPAPDRITIDSTGRVVIYYDHPSDPILLSMATMVAKLISAEEDPYWRKWAKEGSDAG